MKLLQPNLFFLPHLEESPINEHYAGLSRKGNQQSKMIPKQAKKRKVDDIDDIFDQKSSLKPSSQTVESENKQSKASRKKEKKLKSVQSARDSVSEDKSARDSVSEDKVVIVKDVSLAEEGQSMSELTNKKGKLKLSEADKNFMDSRGKNRKSTFTDRRTI